MPPAFGPVPPAVECPVKSILIAAVACLVITVSPLWSQTPDVDLLEEEAFKTAAAIAEPSIVQIQTIGGLDVVGELIAGSGPTTGVVVSADGEILTSSFNFASKPSSVIVMLGDGRKLPAEIVATDQIRQVTLIRVKQTGLTPIAVAPRKELQVGQWTIALGRTYDPAFPNLSVGILSALNRIWGKAVQTDAKISPANYGGPLVDLQDGASASWSRSRLTEMTQQQASSGTTPGSDSRCLWRRSCPIWRRSAKAKTCVPDEWV